MDMARKFRHYLIVFLRWALLGSLLGCLGGLVGAGFHHTLHFVTHVRGENRWLILLLPVGGLLTVGLYKLLHLQTNRGTNEIIDAALHGKRLSLLIAPGIFLATSITHLLGGSAGREGAALQLGGTMGSALGQLLRLQTKDNKVLIMSGMSAVFAGLFGTPLTACLFTMVFESVGTIFSPALLPCYLAAYTASRIAGCFGVHAEGMLLDPVDMLQLPQLWKLAVLAVAVSLLGILMCRLFHEGEHLARKFLPNAWIRVVVGALLIAGMTLLVGDHRFNGALASLTALTEASV